MTRRARAPYAAGVVVALMSLASLGACGNDAPARETTTAPTTAPTTASTASPTPAETRPPADGPSETAPTATGEAQPDPLDAGQVAEVLEAGFDVEQGADLTTESGLGLLSGEGRIAFGSDPASLEMALTSAETGDAAPIQVLVVDGVLYLADRDRFLGVEVDSPSNPFGASLTDQLDPRTVLAAVQASYRSAQDLGPVAQEGLDLEGYRVVADGPSTLAAIAPDLADQPDRVVPDEVVADIGVDAEGLVRRVTVDLGAENGALTYALDGWGRDVTVAAPPAARVDDLELPR